MRLQNSAPDRVKLSLVWLASLPLCLVSLLPQFYTGYSWLDPAETIYHVRELAGGRIPYRDIFTHHFAGYFAPFYLVNLVISLTPFVFWTLAVLYLWLTCVLLSLSAYIMSGFGTAALVCLVAATLGHYPGWGGDLFLNQSYYQPLLALLLLAQTIALSRWTAFLAFFLGLSAGTLITQDQRFLPFIALLLIPLLKARRLGHSKHILPLGIGLLLLPVAACAFLWVNDAFDEFISQTVLFPLFHRNSSYSEGPAVILLSLLKDGWRLEPLSLSLALIALVALPFVRLNFEYKISLFLFLILSLLSVALAGREFIHYLVFLGPIVSFLVGHVVAWGGGLFPRLMKPLLVVLASTIAISFLSPLIRIAKFGSAFVELRDETIEETVNYLSDQKLENGDVLVWGYAPQIYLRLGLLSNFRDVSLFSIVGTYQPQMAQPEEGVLTEEKQRLIAYLKNTPPRFIIVYNVRGEKALETGAFQGRYRMPTVPQPQFDLERYPHLGFMKSFIDDNYSLALRVDNEIDWSEIYELTIRAVD